MRFVPFVVATFLLLPLVAQAAGAAAITRVAAYEFSDHEWIEVTNAGDAPLDLTGWKFWEDNINHGLTAFRGTLTIAPGETAVIADVAATYVTEHREWTGTVIDSSWSTLNLDGEPIGLRDPAGTLTQFPEALWMKDAPGTPPAEPPPAPAPAPTPEPQPAAQNTATPTAGQLLLSEFLPAPEDGGEWIELQNVSSIALSLDGLELHDAVGRIAALSGTIGPGAYRLVTLTSSKLNNGGDTLALLSGAMTLDLVRYGDDALPAPDAGTALARAADGWQPTTTPTPGAENRITAPPEKPTTAKKNDVVEPNTTIKAGSVLVNEIAPQAADGDWLEIANRTDRRLNLSGWKILVGAASEIPLSGHVAAGGRLLVRLTGDALPDASILFLVSGDGQTIDQASYGSYEDGKVSDNAPTPEANGSVARHEGQDTDVDAEDFFLPLTPTPGRANVETDDEPLAAAGATTRTVILPLCVLPEEIPEPVRTTSSAASATKTTATAKKAPAKKTTVKKSTVAPAVAATLAEIPDLPEKARVHVEGIVVGAPAPVSGRIWYVADENGAAKIQISGMPRAFAAGDRLRVIGTVGWTSGPVIYTKSADVTALGGAASTTPAVRPLDELGADDGHRYVAVRGEVVDRRNDRLTLEDGMGRLAVTLPPGIAAQTGDVVTAAGIYLNGDPARLLVLTAGDVSVTERPLPGSSPPKAAAPNSRDSPWPLVGALATLAAGCLVLAPRLIKKTVSLNQPTDLPSYDV